MNIPRHKLLLLILDIIIITLAVMAGHFLYFHVIYQTPNPTNDHLFHSEDFLFFSLLPFFLSYKLYRYHVILNLPRHISTLTKAIINGFAVVLFVEFLIKSKDLFNGRVLLLVILVFLFLLFFIVRVLLVPAVYQFLLNRHLVTKRLLIIGAGEYGQEMATYISKSKKSYYEIIGFLDDDDEKIGHRINEWTIISSIKNINTVLADYHVKDILIAINNIENNRLNEIIRLVRSTGQNVFIVSKHFKDVSEKLDMEEVGNINAFKIRSVDKSVYDMFANIYDFIFAALVIIITFPLWIIIILAIKQSSKGPVFYKPVVIGKNQKVFKMFKFRTMYHNADTTIHKKYVESIIKNNDLTEKLTNDPRITSVGRFLRKYSLDEFPQLINVLRCDMKLVGPRPCLQYEVNVMEDWHKQRFIVKPGLTGLWQINGRNLVPFNEQIAFDIFYIENRTFRMDFEILLKTIPVVLFGKGGK